MPNCVKCVNEIADTMQSLACADCKGFFHPECTRVESFETYKKLTVRKKASWKCDACVSESASSVSHDSRGEPEPTLSALMDAFQCLGKNLGSQMAEVKSSIDGVKTELTGVNNTIVVMQATLNTLVAENEARKEEFTKILKENVELREDLVEMQQKVCELEQYSRRDNVEVVGVPYTRGEDIYSVLDKLGAVLKLKFDRGTVSVAHRLPSKNKQAHPNIVVRFVSREEKTAWVRAARENRARLTAASLSDTWQSTPIYVNDHLTPHFKMILGRAKQHVKDKRLAFAWTRDCRVFARKSTSPDCPATLLRTLQDLDQLVK